MLTTLNGNLNLVGNENWCMAGIFFFGLNLRLKVRNILLIKVDELSHKAIYHQETSLKRVSRIAQDLLVSPPVYRQISSNLACFGVSLNS